MKFQIQTYELYRAQDIPYIASAGAAAYNPSNECTAGQINPIGIGDSETYVPIPPALVDAVFSTTSQKDTGVSIINAGGARLPFNLLQSSVIHTDYSYLYPESYFANKISFPHSFAQGPLAVDSPSMDFQLLVSRNRNPQAGYPLSQVNIGTENTSSSLVNTIRNGITPRIPSIGGNELMKPNFSIASTFLPINPLLLDSFNWGFCGNPSGDAVLPVAYHAAMFGGERMKHVFEASRETSHIIDVPPINSALQLRQLFLRLQLTRTEALVPFLNSPFLAQGLGAPASAVSFTADLKFLSDGGGSNFFLGPTFQLVATTKYAPGTTASRNGLSYWYIRILPVQR
jgi:hypothetical protein